MKKILLAVFALVLSFGAKAQIEAPVKWSYAANKISATEAMVYIKATIDDKWHIYGLDESGKAAIKTSFTFTPSKNYSVVGLTTQPKPLKKYEAGLKADVTYFEKSVIFQQKIKLKPGKANEVKGRLSYIACNDHKCLPPEDVDFSIPLGK